MEVRGTMPGNAKGMAPGMWGVAKMGPGGEEGLAISGEEAAGERFEGIRIA